MSENITIDHLENENDVIEKVEGEIVGPEEAVRKENMRQVKGLLKTVGMFLAVIVATVLMNKFVLMHTIVSGESMLPTLNNNDRLISGRLHYMFSDPERFDVIVFRPDMESKGYYIKRVIGLPGETVQIIEGFVYINGEKLESDVYGKDVIVNANKAAQPITLKENEYFVLGDNRNNSRDSRAIGPIMKDQISAKALFRFWPFNQIGGLN